MDKNKQEYYQKIFKEYQELKIKTAMDGHDVKKHGGIKLNNILSKDMILKSKLQEELVSGLNFLSDEQLIELAGDNDLKEEVNKILSQRKG